MSAVVKRFWMPAAASVALGYLVVMLAAGALPERRQLVQSEAHGVLQLAPERITRVTVVGDARPAIFVRQGDGWFREGSAAAVEADLAEIIDRAVKFMHTANPVRALEHQEIADAGLAEFGLDHPRLGITLEDAGGVALEADFGNHSADGLLQYMRLRDRDGLYLMSGFVGKEWQAVLDGGHRDEGQATRSLVPLPIGEVAAIEIYARDKSYRFERDPGGAWLLHRHAPGDDPNAPHRADPAESERIAQALAAFGQIPIERSVASGAGDDAYALADPEAVIVLFTGDEARPARLCGWRPRGRPGPLPSDARPRRHRRGARRSDHPPDGFRRRARALTPTPNHYLDQRLRGLVRDRRRVQGSLEVVRATAAAE